MSVGSSTNEGVLATCLSATAYLTVFKAIILPTLIDCTNALLRIAPLHYLAVSVNVYKRDPTPLADL